jgi:hypothetical protein
LTDAAANSFKDLQASDAKIALPFCPSTRHLLDESEVQNAAAMAEDTIMVPASGHPSNGGKTTHHER